MPFLHQPDVCDDDEAKKSGGCDHEGGRSVPVAEEGGCGPAQSDGEQPVADLSSRVSRSCRGAPSAHRLRRLAPPRLRGGGEDVTRAFRLYFGRLETSTMR